VAKKATPIKQEHEIIDLIFGTKIGEASNEKSTTSNRMRKNPCLDRNAKHNVTRIATTELGSSPAEMKK
jgi:hypothetical protein